MKENFYDKFYKKSSISKAKASDKEKKEISFKDSEHDFARPKNQRAPSPIKSEKNDRKRSHLHRKESSSGKSQALKRQEMFLKDRIPRDSQKIIEEFDQIVASVRNLSGKQKVTLYTTIKNLSHQLTDDRSSRRLGYMNEAPYISAYISYFMWWNLVRLTRLFANLPDSSFDSLLKSEKPVALDIGSGTLTVVIALWLARPELRAKNISWYCMDLSQTALAAGEEVYLAIAAKTLRQENQSSDKEQKEVLPWNIIRVKGAFGTSIKEKADFITCANVFNEILQRNEMPTDFLAKKYTKNLLDYLKKGENSPESSSQSLLLVEPGDPHSARFISLMRDALIRENFSPLAPCPHTFECPMAGRTKGKNSDDSGRNSKWCNFAFDTEDAPKNLLKISEKAGLPKDRAGLSFIFSSNAKRNPSQKDFSIRIASDFIRLPDLHKSAYYACSSKGLLLAVDQSHLQPKNGELIQIKMPEDLSERDQKSGAIIVRI